MPPSAAQFAGIALGHVGREYPNKLGQVLTADADLAPPRLLHPIFHGSFDWHSCVHGYWTLATVLRLFPALPEAAGDPSARFDAMFTDATLSPASARSSPGRPIAASSVRMAGPGC